MNYREMEQAPPERPRRPIAWEGVLKALLVALFLAVLAAFVVATNADQDASDARGRLRSDPATWTESERCTRGGGWWSAGEIDGKRAAWCTWGPR